MKTDFEYCFPCKHPGDYLYDSMKYFVSENIICADHKSKFEAMPKPKEKYILVVGPQPPKASDFLPKQIPVKPDFNERPENRGDLIE